MAIVSQDWSSFYAIICFLIYLVPLLALLVNTEGTILFFKRILNKAILKKYIKFTLQLRFGNGKN